MRNKESVKIKAIRLPFLQNFCEFYTVKVSVICAFFQWLPQHFTGRFRRSDPLFFIA